MIEKIIIAGAGGQGIMLMGKVLASACLKENKHVTWMPSYGAEVRGGTAHCLVVISDEEIGSPYIKEADTLIIMNEPSWRRFKSRVKEKGLLVVNSSLVKKNTEKNMGVLQHPFTDIALKLGNIKVANMVALGCYIAKKKIINVSSILEVIKEMAPQDKKNLIAINKQALEEGLKLK
ncbi:MAG: 2-oxoacid:acceptor oxidoreductase family protein [Candidatus Omnitrophica bacterium]|nr:2-oxoacid:acceptor oxidoreductase family protein [Candidatus Omnitrophota bacterium]